MRFVRVSYLKSTSVWIATESPDEVRIQIIRHDNCPLLLDTSTLSSMRMLDLLLFDLTFYHALLTRLFIPLSNTSFTPTCMCGSLLGAIFQLGLCNRKMLVLENVSFHHFHDGPWHFTNIFWLTQESNRECQCLWDKIFAEVKPFILSRVGTVGGEILIWRFVKFAQTIINELWELMLWYHKEWKNFLKLMFGLELDGKNKNELYPRTLT